MKEVEFQNVLSKSQGSRLTRTEPKSVSKFLAISPPARLPSGYVLEVQRTFKELVLRCSTCMRAQLLSHVQLCVTLWAAVNQAPQSMGFSRQEYWSGVPFPPGDLPDPGTETTLLYWWVGSLPLSHQGSRECSISA